LNDQILNAIDEELERLRQARALLTDSQARPTGKSAGTSAAPRRILSVQARRAIADAQRRRWAKVRRQKKTAAPAAEAKKESVAS
jgi:hypothetical protein